MLYSGDWVNDRYPKRAYKACMTRCFQLVPKQQTGSLQ